MTELRHGLPVLVIRAHLARNQIFREFRESHVVPFLKRHVGRIFPEILNYEFPEAGLEILGAVVVLLQFVPIRGEQPFERIPNEYEFRIIVNHVFRFGRGIILQAREQIFRVNLVRRKVDHVGNVIGFPG